MELPHQEELSLNQAARHCAVESEKFRKLVGAFESMGPKLPRRVDKDGKELKVIPREILYVFESAALYMQVEKFEVDAAMQAAFTRRSVRDMHQVVEMVSRIGPLLKLPRDINDAARRLGQVLERKQEVVVDVRNVSAIREALQEADRRATINWWAFVMAACIALLLLGASVRFLRLEQVRDAQVAQELNDLRYQLRVQANRR